MELCVPLEVPLALSTPKAANPCPQPTQRGWRSSMEAAVESVQGYFGPAVC